MEEPESGVDNPEANEKSRRNADSKSKAKKR